MKNRFLTSKDYARLYEKARRALGREFLKPSDELDEGLIEELEETMLYCAERKKVLLSEEKQRRRLQPSYKMRRALVIVVAVLASFAVFATVAQAAGFRVWSAIVHWDINYLRVDYTENATETPDDQDIDNGNEPVEEDDAITINFDSYDALIAYMGDRVLFPSGMDGLEFVSAYVIEDDEAVAVHTKYQLNDSIILIHNIIVMSAEFDTTTILNQDDSSYDNVYTKDINGCECILGLKEGSTYCSFVYNLSTYLIICNAEQENCISIAESILEGAVS